MLFRRRAARSKASAVRVHRATPTLVLCLVALVAGGLVVRHVGIQSLQSTLKWPWWLLLGALGISAAVLGSRAYLMYKAARARSIEILIPKVPDGVPGDEIVAELRQELLTVIHLSSPTVVPGESSSQDFVADVRTAAGNPTGWGVLTAALGTVIRLGVSKPYRVNLVARRHDNQHIGLTVEVSSRVTGETAVTTVHDDQWDSAARRAAYAVAAFVLPRSNLSRKAPWIAWRGIELSPELFYSFQTGRRLAGNGRLEEALHSFDEALIRDPLNSYIKVERATVLDQLGLYVDALAAYVDAVTTESWYDRKLWLRYRAVFGDNHGGWQQRRWFAASPCGPAALQLARYRMVISLARSNSLVEQWQRNLFKPAQERRRDEATRVIRRLRPLLPGFQRRMLECHGQSPDDASVPSIERDRDTMQRVIQFAALNETLALCSDYRWWRWRRLAHALPISQTAIRLMPIWAMIQYGYVDLEIRRANPASPSGEYWLDTLRNRPMARLARRAGRSSREWKADQWPPPADRVRRAVRRALSVRPLARHGWQEHYNAACVFAVAMSSPNLYPTYDQRFTVQDTDADNHQRFTRLAVHQLTHAVIVTDSEFTSGVAPWMLRGDQDLIELRGTDDYLRFVDRYLPQNAQISTPPRNVVRLTMAHNFVSLIERYAEVCWRRIAESRARNVDPMATGGLLTEVELWRVLREFCRDYRDWHTRYRFIRTAEQHTPKSIRFDPRQHGIEQDEYWLSVSKVLISQIRDETGDGQTPPLGEGAPGSEPGRALSARYNEVERELRVSGQLRDRSKYITIDRDAAMKNLHDILAECRWLDDPLNPGAGVESPVDEPSAEEFSEAWAAVASWMRSLRTTMDPQSGDRASTLISALWHAPNEGNTEPPPERSDRPPHPRQPSEPGV